MIVSEKNIKTALAYMSENPHPLALAKQKMMMAELERDTMRAKLFTEAEGTIEDRKARVELSASYQSARRVLIDAEFEVENHKRRLHAADKLTDIFQTESANERRFDRAINSRAGD